MMAVNIQEVIQRGGRGFYSGFSLRCHLSGSQVSGLYAPAAGQRGFTLIELLIVAVTMSVAAVLSVSVLSGNTDQENFSATVNTFAQIEKGLLGVTSDRVKGDVRFAGYVQDMGALPALYDVLGTPRDKSDDQPLGLWMSGTQVDADNDQKADGGDLDGDGEIDLIFYRAYTFNNRVEFVRLGWRGGYINAPAGNVLNDGWGNPLVFEKIDDTFSVTSLGADGKKGGRGYNMDIVRSFRKRDYTASVSGHVCPHTVFTSPDNIRLRGYSGGGEYPPPVEVRIYHAPEKADCPLYNDDKKSGYPLSECLAYTSVFLTEEDIEDGYFRLDNIPVGSERFLLVLQPVNDDGGNQKYAGMGYKITVEPGEIWLGTLGTMP